MTWEQLDERIRGGGGAYPPCEWEQCGEESVIAIVGEAGDIWLCQTHHELWDFGAVQGGEDAEKEA